MISYPYGVELDGREWKEGRLYQGFEPDKTYLPSPKFMSEMEKFAGDEGVNFINAYDGFKNNYSFPLTYSFDGHWNAQGHRIMAKILYDHLAAKGIGIGSGL